MEYNRNTHTHTRHTKMGALPASRTFRTASARRRCLLATLSFGHDRQSQATNKARQSYPLAGCRHRSCEHWKGSLEHDPGSGSFWCRYCPSHHDQGEFHSERTRYPRVKFSQDKMANEQDCVDLGILCGNVCGALKRGTDGKRADELSELVRDAIRRLET